MENIEELHRQAEEVKIRLKKDITALNDIVKRAISGSVCTKKLEAHEAILKAERRLNEMVSDFESRFENAMDTVAANPASNQNITRQLNFTDFNSIEISCAFHARIIRSEKYSISVTANESLIEYIEVNKSANTLKLTLKPHQFSLRPALEVKISMPKLSKLRLGATSRATVTGFNSKEALSIRLTGSSLLETDISAGQTACEISGASRLTGKLQTEDAEFTLSGASRVELSGAARNVTLNAWGASDVNLENFTANDMVVNLNAASEAVINNSGKLDIDLTSGSRLVYADHPTIRNISVTGASSLINR